MVISRRLLFCALVSIMGWPDPGTPWKRGLERGVGRQTSLLRTQRLAPKTWEGLALSLMSCSTEEESTKVAPSTWCRRRESQGRGTRQRRLLSQHSFFLKLNFSVFLKASYALGWLCNPSVRPRLGQFGAKPMDPCTEGF